MVASDGIIATVTMMAERKRVLKKIPNVGRGVG
jgi:hypothetical protein